MHIVYGIQKRVALILVLVIIFNIVSPIVAYAQCKWLQDQIDYWEKEARYWYQFWKTIKKDFKNAKQKLKDLKKELSTLEGTIQRLEKELQKAIKKKSWNLVKQIAAQLLKLKPAFVKLLGTIVIKAQLIIDFAVRLHEAWVEYKMAKDTLQNFIKKIPLCTNSAN